MNQQFDPNQQNREPHYTSEDTYQNGPDPVNFDGPMESPELRKNETVALILGILSLVLASCCCVNLILAIISICFALKTKRLTETVKISSMGLAGLICSIIGLIIFVLYIILIVLVVILSVLYGTELFHFTTQFMY